VTATITGETLADWLTIMIGIIIGIILISMPKPKEKRSTRRSRRREEDELDSWDLQDQLEGDEV